MPLTTLDPKVALIVVDIQNGILSAPVPHSMDQIAENSGRLAAAFRRYGLPVVLVKVAGGAPGRKEHRSAGGARPANWHEFRSELDEQSGDHVVVKRTWGAFTNTGLEDHLKKLGVTQVVVTGCATSIGAESTARQAHECGFNVALALDALSDVDEFAHVNSVTRIFPRLGETGSTEDVLTILETTRA